MPREDWHLDKKVPIAIIAAIFIQTITYTWIAATYTARNDAENARQTDDIRDLKVSAASTNDMKADVAVIKSNLTDIKAKLDKIR